MMLLHNGWMPGPPTINSETCSEVIFRILTQTASHQPAVLCTACIDLIVLVVAFTNITLNAFYSLQNIWSIVSLIPLLPSQQLLSRFYNFHKQHTNYRRLSFSGFFYPFWEERLICPCNRNTWTTNFRRDHLKSLFCWLRVEWDFWLSSCWLSFINSMYQPAYWADSSILERGGLTGFLCVRTALWTLVPGGTVRCIKPRWEEARSVPSPEASCICFQKTGVDSVLTSEPLDPAQRSTSPHGRCTWSYTLLYAFRLLFVLDGYRVILPRNPIAPAVELALTSSETFRELLNYRLPLLRTTLQKEIYRSCGII